MANGNGKALTNTLLGTLGKWIIGGLLTALVALVLYIWSDLSGDNKSLSTQIINLDKKVERIATIQERVLTDVDKNTNLITDHLINDGR